MKILKVALVHYWLVGMRGGERVLEALAELFPEADIFTLVVDVDNISEVLRSRKITASFLQYIGGVKHYKKMLPLMPFALESLDVTSYDLVISSEAGPAKGVITGPNSVHICYCHSPMRYIWDLYPQYYKQGGRLTKAMMSTFSPLLRQWDVTTAARVDFFIANSGYVAKRIKKFYRRDCSIINPPVDVGRFLPKTTHDDFYLFAGQVTPYKRLDVAIEAFNTIGQTLIVVGAGTPKSLKKISLPNIIFIEDAHDDDMADYFSRCKALIYPGVEDFGIVPLEVMASGRPVIAYAQGGALETVIENQTGIFFFEQTATAMIRAIKRFEGVANTFHPAALAAHAAKFSTDVFKQKISIEISKCIQSGQA